MRNPGVVKSRAVSFPSALFRRDKVEGRRTPLHFFAAAMWAYDCAFTLLRMVSQLVEAMLRELTIADIIKEQVSSPTN